MRRVAMMAGALAIGGAGGAIAQSPMAMAPGSACPVTANPWQGARSVAAARTLGGNPNPALALGEKVDATLVPVDRMTLASPLGKPIVAGDRGGLLTFHVALGGAYRVALGDHAWIDMTQRGVPLVARTHARGAPCSGIAKTVDFALSPGDYVLQVSAARAAHIPVQISLLP
jgi:hypothetical protein